MSLHKTPLMISELLDNTILNMHKEKFDPSDFALDGDNVDYDNPIVFWYKFMEKIVLVLNSKHREMEIKKNDFSKLLEWFELDTMVYIYINYPEYRSLEVERALEFVDEKCGLISSLMSMSHQWYLEKRNNEIVFDLWKKMNQIEDKEFFNDKRFKAYPMYTNAYQKGFDRSPWLKGKAAGWITVLETESGEKKLQRYSDGAYNSNYMDAKIGISIYFKDMPSMLISFNVDADWNLYIHQVQCKPKDRGHYKVENWQEACVNAVKNMFPEYKCHLITGESSSNIVRDSYKSSDPSLAPSLETLKRITENYNKIFVKNIEKILKSDIQYKIL